MKHICEKKTPFTKQQIEELIKKYPTPFYIYDESAIRKNVQNVYKAFSWVPQFKNYFAVKGLPNHKILKILAEEQCGADCSSLGELVLAKRAGITGENIMFSSNDTPAIEFKKARELEAIINFDDIRHIEFFEKNVGPLPDIISLRYNPGDMKKGNAIIGDPKEAKYGLTHKQIFEGYKILQEKRVKRFGLHTMMVSNEQNINSYLETIDIFFSLAGEIYKKLGITFEFLNVGGGLGIPYKPQDQPLDIQKISRGMRGLYHEKVLRSGHPEVPIVMESARYITGPFGYLVSKVLHEKNTYKKYLGLDACMANLMRPAIYGAYHHISVLGKETSPQNCMYDVTGSLCENNDKFAIDRKLPHVQIGDILVIHDAGAHGHAMGFQYNAKLRSAEFLLKKNRTFEMIRRAETLDDYFATLSF
jgi:diaminopimelate decarboxylase